MRPILLAEAVASSSRPTRALRRIAPPSPTPTAAAIGSACRKASYGGDGLRTPHSVGATTTAHSISSAHQTASHAVRFVL